MHSFDVGWSTLWCSYVSGFENLQLKLTCSLYIVWILIEVANLVMCNFPLDIPPGYKHGTYLNVNLTDDYSTLRSSLNLSDENVYSTPEAVEGTCD